MLPKDGLFPYPKKISENQSSSDVFRGYRKRPVNIFARIIDAFGTPFFNNWVYLLSNINDGVLLRIKLKAFTAKKQPQKQHL